ncbi:MAG: hypothetical protein ACREU7_11075 [Burkholderiales bacterium]
MLADIAQFEWARGEAFDAPDADHVDLEAIANIPPASWPGLRFTLHPTVHRLQLAWNAPVICKALASGSDTVQPQHTTAQWLLWRNPLDVYWRSLDPGEAAALDAAAAGASFAEICEGLLKWLDADAVVLQAAGLLKRWAVDGLLAEVLQSPAICSSTGAESGKGKKGSE